MKRVALLAMILVIIAMTGSFAWRAIAQQPNDGEMDGRDLAFDTNNGDTYGALIFLVPAGKKFCAVIISRTDSSKDEDAILHPVYASSEELGYEWSLKDRGKLEGSITVKWIANGATDAERTAARCTAYPEMERLIHRNPPKAFATIEVSDEKTVSPPLRATWATPRFDEQRSGGTGSVERDLSTSAPEGYVLCKPLIDEQERDPQSFPVEYSASGYLLISASQTQLKWQAWVESAPHFWGAGHSINVNFGALWIKPGTSKADFVANGCLTDLPAPQTRHVVRKLEKWFPFDDTTSDKAASGGVRVPNAGTQFNEADLIVCRYKGGQKNGTTHVRVAWSPRSCNEALTALKGEEASRDLCEFNFDEHVPYLEVDHYEAKWTSTCGAR